MVFVRSVTPEGSNREHNRTNVDCVSRRSVQIELLGGFSLGSGAQTISSLPRTTTSLLSYLVVHRSRAQTRDLLAGRFWSDLPDDKARKRLSNALWQMRKALADADLSDFVVASAGSVKISSEFDVEVDSERFEQELDRIEEVVRRGRNIGIADDLSEVLEQFPGEFLEGFYDDWIDDERSRVADRYESGLQQLARLYKARTDYESALRALRLLLAHDPLKEENHREVMRTCAMLGDGASAERYYENCRKILWNELKVEPSEETKILIERIRADALTVTHFEDEGLSELNVPMVGRAKERSVLLSRADDLNAGAGGLILVEGDAGIGKSRLIEDFIEGAEWRRLRVLRAGHSHLSPMQPYDGLKQALTPATIGLRAEHLVEILDPVWIQQVAPVLPELANFGDGHNPVSALKPSEELSRMSEALARVVLAQGALGPTVIVLEDVHWCDQDSFDVFRHLGARLAQTPVLVVLTYRRFEAEQSEHVWSSLSKLDTQPYSSRIMLQPLNLYELQDLVSGLHGPGDLTVAAASQLLEKTEGNPLFALESFRSSVSRAASESIPTSLEAALAQRLRALDPIVAKVVQTASVLSGPFSVAMLAEIVSLSRAEVLEALSNAIQAGFVSDLENGRFEFSHSHSQQLVYEGLSDEKRLQIHGKIYDWMEGEPDAGVEQLAFHACLADRWDKGYIWHVEAADRALEMNAFRTAAENFAKADYSAGEAGFSLVDIAPVLLRYEMALDVLGERSEQELVIKRLTGEPIALDVELQLAERHCWYLANTDEPAEAIRLALSSAERAADNGLSPFSFLTIAGTALIWSGDAEGAIKPLTDVVSQCESVQDRLAAETMLGKAYADLFQLEPAAMHLANALETARELGDVRAQVETLGHQAVLDWHNGSYRQAESTLLEGLELSDSIGYRHGEGLNLVNLATLNGTLGRGGRALNFFDRATEVFSAHGNRRGEAIVQVNLAELHHLLLGDDDHASTLATSAAVYFRSTNNVRIETLALCTMSSIDARRGRPRRARQRMNQVLERAVEAEDEVSQLEIRFVLGFIDLVSERYEDAIQHLEAASYLAEKHQVDSILPIALARKAKALIETNQLAAAVRCAERAAKLNISGSRQPHVTAWLCGQVFEQAGSSALAAEQFAFSYERLAVSLEGLSGDVARRAWSSVPEHVAIEIAYESRYEKSKEVSLPRLSAASGRPLRPQDYVTINWVISEPADWAGSSTAERRRARLTRLAKSAIAQGAVARVSDLAMELGVSDRTIKRDLVILRTAGHEVTTRKGELRAQSKE